MENEKRDIFAEALELLYQRKLKRMGISAIGLKAVKAEVHKEPEENR